MIYQMISSLLHKADPELAHNLAIQFLKNDYLPLQLFQKKFSKKLEINILGKNFKHPVGLAAGFDKNAEIYNSIFKLGFSFAEVGTVTPLPQPGNPKPRVFRLTEDRSIINRLGFPSLGMKEVRFIIEKKTPKGVLGINIGPNKDSSSKIEDYLNCFENFCNLCDYICNKIQELLVSIKNKQKQLHSQTKILLKISPDINDQNISELATILLDQKIDGVVLTNTTIHRSDNLLSSNKVEAGGLSGESLELISNTIIKKFYKILKNQIPIIGVGGVHDGQSALRKIKSGASLLQLYTALVYEGPNIVNKINEELVKLLELEGFESLQDAVGKDCVD
jgi:dihydroorotate dehydrogenase